MQHRVIPLILFSVSTVLSFPGHISVHPCREPENYLSVTKALKEQIERDYYQDMGSVIFPDYYAGYKPIADETRATVTNTTESVARHAKLYGSASFNCDAEKKRVLHSSSTMDLGKREQHERSVCPWDVLLDYDPLRIPQSIAKARCLCDECLSKETLAAKHGKPVVGCVPVNSFVPVILKTCVEGEYVYNVEMQAAPVGCTCGRLDEDK